MLKIREELPEDIPAIREINQKAFGQPDEGRIVDELRKNSDPFISLVADIDSQLAGHILFTPVLIESSEFRIEGMGLAPMAVLPEFQKQGIGKALVDEGIERLRNRDCPFVVVLGHSEYYPKFGFEPAGKYGLKCEWDVPDDAFMVIQLRVNALKDLTGIVKYRPEFS